jgi:hypothetical protein
MYSKEAKAARAKRRNEKMRKEQLMKNEAEKLRKAKRQERRIRRLATKSALGCTVSRDSLVDALRKEALEDIRKENEAGIDNSPTGHFETVMVAEAPLNVEPKVPEAKTEVPAIPHNMIDITGVDLVKFVQKVYELSVPQGLGFLHATSGGMDISEAQEIVNEGSRNRYSDIVLDLDYVHGRACKMTVWVNHSRLIIRKPWYDHSNEKLRQLLEAVGIKAPEEMGQHSP